MSNKGFFVISLDFELYWGMFDKVTLEEYGKNIEGVHTVIPKILSVFSEHEIHATWATVGMLMYKDASLLRASLPDSEHQPAYPDMRVSSYEHIKQHTLTDVHHFAPQLVTKIVETPHQELGSHTFSHYYCLDGTENGEAIFRADCEALNKVVRQFKVPVTSIVFPRNQTTEDALSVCREFGITTYRGTPSHFLYTGKREREQTHPLLRLLRLVDAYVNISGHHTYTLLETKEKILTNVSGSRFLRPYSTKLRFFEKVRIQRIKNSMTFAAKHNQIFHLWWHPHNFGINQKENIGVLLELISHYKMLEKQYGMQSATMQEIATLANE